MKRNLSVKGIKMRWQYYNIAIAATLIIFVILATIAVSSVVIDGVKQAVDSRINAISSVLSDNYKTSIEYKAQIRKSVENFSEKYKMELMALDFDGKAVITSSGFQADNLKNMPDFERALGSKNSSGEYLGRLKSGERVYSRTVLTQVPNDEFRGLRLTVSLEQIDKQIFMYAVLFNLIGIAFFVIISYINYVFIYSIVTPITQASKTAREIAKGDYSVRIEKKYKYEIGELCDIINSLASELSLTESVKNDFISSVSHELRTPLTAIKGWAETLLLSGQTDVDIHKKGMKVIVNETTRLSEMVEELLDFSRMQNSNLQLINEKLDILAELSEAVIMFTQRAKNEGIKIEFNEPISLPPVWGDKNRLRQVFINILDNALKYSDSPSKVNIEAEATKTNVLIYISDTGIGISELDLPKVKERFYKADKTRRGSGIGLAVADEIVRLSDGKLIIESEEGIGTTVTISLPRFDKR